MLLTKLQIWLGFHWFFHCDSVCSRIQSRISHWVQLSCLLGLRLWRFLCYFLRPWQFWRVLVRYFVECPSIWVCLIFFSSSSSHYWTGLNEFWGRILQRSAGLITWYQEVQWCQHDLPLVRLILRACIFIPWVYTCFTWALVPHKVAIPFRWGPLLCLLCVSSSQNEDLCCWPARSRKNTFGPHDAMSI